MSGLSRTILTACRVPFSTEAESGLSGIIAPGCCLPTGARAWNRWRRALQHPDDAQEAVELRVGWGVERRGGAGGDVPRGPAGARGARRGAPLDRGRDRNGQEGRALGRRGPPVLWRAG